MQTQRLDRDDIARDWEAASHASRPPLVVLSTLGQRLDRLGLSTVEMEVRPIGDGHSNPTFAVTSGDTTVVLRRPPRPPYTRGAHNVLREARILQSLRGTPVQVPDVLDVCEDESVIGAPFYLMSWVEGETIGERLPVALDSPGAKDAIARQLVDQLTALHEVDWQGRKLTDFGRPDGYLERQVLRLAEGLDVPGAREIPEFSEVARWLLEMLPESSDAAIVHGDYRMGNVLFRLDYEPEIRAVLDWEMSTIGDPLADIGYLCAMWPNDGSRPGASAFGLTPRDAGFPPVASLVDQYAERRGTRIDGLHWYQVLALWKLAIVLEGSYRRHLQGTTDDPFFTMLEDGVPALVAEAHRVARGGSL